jgi:hypothetical protein
MSGETATTPAGVHKTSGGNNAYHNFHNDFLHIQDPNERRRLALAEIDKAPFGWYHVRYAIPEPAILVAYMLLTRRIIELVLSPVSVSLPTLTIYLSSVF